MNHLDVREQGGYERHQVMLETREPPHLEAVVYVAGPSNPHYLGPASLEEIAADKIVFTRPEPVEGEDEAEAEA